MAKKSYEIDMCNGPILKKILLFAIPLACANILQLLFNAVDIIVVGRYVGDEALAAVGSTTHIINLFISVFMGLSVGVNVLVARKYGAKDQEGISRAVRTSVAISLMCGLVLACLGIVFATPILRLVNAPEDILPLAKIYLQFYFAGMPVIMFYNFGAAVLRAVGDTRRPLFYLTIAGVINVLLNLFFVLVLDMSVVGVALATTLSQVVSAVFVFRAIMTSGFGFPLKEIRIYKRELKEIVRVGLPAGIQSSFFSISNVIVQSAVNGFGSVVVAGGAAASNIGGFIQKALDSFTQATVSFTSQNVGAKKTERINRVLFTSLGCVVAIGTTTAMMCYFGGEMLLKLYTDNPAAIANGMVRLRYIGCFYVFLGIMSVFANTIRGMGYSLLPMISTLLGTAIFRIAWIQTVIRVERFRRVELVYVVYPISWVLTAIALAIAFVILKKKLIRKFRG